MWGELKGRFKELGGEYTIDKCRKTWSAFTPYQWYPQRISFAVAKLTARLVIAGVKSSSVQGRVRGDSNVV